MNIERLQQLKRLIGDGKTDDVYDELIRDYEKYGMDYALVSAQGTRIRASKNIAGTLTFDETQRQLNAANFALNEMIDVAIKKGGGAVQPAAPHGSAAPAGFDAAAFVLLLQGDSWDIRTINFPNSNASALQDFLDNINTTLPTGWKMARQRGKLALLYRYIKTVFALSQDAALRFEIIRPMEELIEKKEYNWISEDNFNAQIGDLVDKAEAHLKRLEGQEDALRQQKSATQETLRQTYNRLRRLSAAATKHEDWANLMTRIVAENPALAYKFTKLQADVQALSIYSGLNLYNQLLTAGQPTVAERIEKAITLLEQAAEEEQLGSARTVFFFQNPKTTF